MRQIVILRPEPGATATFDRAAEQGLNAVKLPLFEIEPLSWSPPPDLKNFDGLLITSANAIREGGEALEQLKSLPVYAVGPATAAAARTAGFKVAKTGPARVRALLRGIDPDLRLLHLAGEDRIDHRRAWQKITTVPVYRARMLDADPAAIEGSVVLVHSPRAGARVADIAKDRASVAIAAISAAAAKACGEGWEKVAAISRPSDLALLALARRLCEESGE